MGKIHLLPGTTYSNVQQKGPTDPEKTASMTLDEIERWLGHAIAGTYHQAVHRGIGKTPLAAWQAGDDRSSSLRVIADPRRLLIDFLPLERRLVRREGIVLHSIAYWSDVLRSMIGDPQPSIVRYDPRDLSRIYWLASDGQYYDLTYADLRRPAISLWEHRAARQQLRQAGHRQIDEQAIFGAIDAMRQLATDATARTKQQRRWRERAIQSGVAPLASPTSPVCPSGRPELPAEIPAGDAPLFEVEEWS